MDLIKENIRYYEACLSKWGINSQLGMLIEECAETIQAISKVWREKALARNKLIAELVDLQLMLDQIKYAMKKGGFEAQYDTEMRIKLQRLGRLLDE